MTRKKSRPTHRENADAVPSNEGGFYKMFWNSMDNTDNNDSPTQGDRISPPLILIDDSPSGSPCPDENLDNITLPQPIKEEFDSGSGENSMGTFPENSRPLGDSSSLPACSPGNLSMSPSKNSSCPEPFPLPTVSSELITEITPVNVLKSCSLENPPCPGDTSSRSPHILEVSLKDGRPDDGDNPLGVQVTSEEPMETRTSTSGTHENFKEILGEPISGDTNTHSDMDITPTSLANDPHEGKGTPSVSLAGLITKEIPEITPKPISPEHSPLSCNELITESHQSDGMDVLPTANVMIPDESDDMSKVPVGLEGTLSLLQKLLNAPDEEINATLDQVPGLSELVGGQQDVSCNVEAERMDEVETSSSSDDNDVSSMQNDCREDLPMSIQNSDKDVLADPSHHDQMVVDEEDEFPKCSFNFLPRKIKLDSIGVMRSVKFLKEQVRTLYKEYLKDDVLLRTIREPQSVEKNIEPLEANNSEQPDEADEIANSFLSNIPYPICCVKMERLPEPLAKKSCVVMSDDTFKTWKRQIIRQRNEEKFRNLKVWRRGRTLLWRECELAGMDRETYDEQVAYVKKHRLDETSSEGEGSGEGGHGSSIERNNNSLSGSSSEDEGINSEDEETSSVNLSSPPKKPSSLEPLSSSTPLEPQPADKNLTGDEYVVENSTADRSTTKNLSALKITIRKASLSKSEEDKDKPSNAESESVPTYPVAKKTRKVAMKRTFRRPSENRVNSLPKPAASDPKKTKQAPVGEDLYDQSLLGTRSHEVENFNLLEKWDIPFEEPTLFRSPRAASRLAQLKTKEAFAPSLKRHAPPKTTPGSTTSAVSKDVKEVVEMLCSKTVEAILFPETKPSSSHEKVLRMNTIEADGKKTESMLTNELSVTHVDNLHDETLSTADESAEIYAAESNSMLDASSDFGGSTTSLLSEDQPPVGKSPQKTRRKRKTGTGWGKKKKKAKEKNSSIPSTATIDLQKDMEDLPKQSHQPVLGDVVSDKAVVGETKDSHTHSTQVPVVSEGPGQNIQETEEELGPRSVKTSQNPTTSSKEKNQPSKVEEYIKKDEPHPTAKVEQETVSPRLTRSQHRTIDLDPDLLANFGTRKNKRKTDSPDDVSQVGSNKQLKRPGKKVSVKNKSNKVQEEVNSTVNEDESNTQVPEVSEGPGEVVEEEKHNDFNKEDTEKPTARLLRSRRRLAPQKDSRDLDSYGANQIPDEIVNVAANENANNNHLVEDVLESPASPPPEAMEPDPMSNIRITRSRKRRSAPAYVAVKLTEQSPLPSVANKVDSIPEPKPTLPLTKLFDVQPALESPKVGSLGEQTSTDTTLVDGVQGSSSCVVGQHSTGSEEVMGESQETVVGKVLDSSLPRTVDSSLPHAVDSSPSQAVDSSPSHAVDSSPSHAVDSSPSHAVDSSPSHAVDSSLSHALNSPLPHAVDSSVPCAVDSSLPHAVDDEPTNKSRDEVGLAGENVELQAPTNASTCLPVGEIQPAFGVSHSLDNQSESLITESKANLLDIAKQSSEKSVSASLEVLSIVNSMKETLATTSTKEPIPEQSVSPLSSSNNLKGELTDVPSQGGVANEFPAVSTPSLPTGNQDITSILPGTFLNSLFSSPLDTNLTTYSSEINDSLADDPGDLVIDESANELDVNFFDNLTNADLSKVDDDDNDFSDDDNNTDLADKIDKIVKDQIYKDPVPVPSLNPKDSSADQKNVGESGEKCLSTLKRDAIDSQTGLPTNFLRRLRDPRIRNRLLSHIEQEGTDKTPSSTLIPVIHNTPEKNGSSDTVVPAVRTSGFDSQSTESSGIAISSAISSTTSVPLVPATTAPAQTVASFAEVGVTTTAGITSALPNMSVLTTPPVLPGTQIHQPILSQATLIQSLNNSNEPEEPPDPTKVSFLVPPSDDEDEEECIKRRTKKAKKEVDVELMYKSPLEDLQSEARPGYGARAPRRYGENFPRRRIEDRRPQWEERRSRIDDSWEGRPPRERSRGRYEYRGREPSRDRRSFRDRSPRERSRDRQNLDLYCDNPQLPYHTPSSNWPITEHAFNVHMGMMQHADSNQIQQNCYPEPIAPTHPPLFGPEPPKIDYMETRLINLELLPKTTNLHVPPNKKVYDYFNKENIQMLQIPPPTYDPTDEPESIRVLDPITNEIVEIPAIRRPTSGLKKEFFRHVPPHLSLTDVVKFHFISPAYVMVADNEGELSSSSEEEEDFKPKEVPKVQEEKQECKNGGKKKKPNKPLIEHNKKRDSRGADESRKHDNKTTCNPFEASLSESRSLLEATNQEPDMGNNPLENLLHNLPLLKQFSKSQSVGPTPPPPPEWNDIDLRVSRLIAGLEAEPQRSASPPKDKPLRPSSGSRSSYQSKRSRSPRRRHRSTSSSSSNMSISPSSSRSSSYSRRESKSSRRRRERSRSSERRSSPRRRSISPRRRSISPRRRSISPRRRSISPRRRSISPTPKHSRR